MGMDAYYKDKGSWNRSDRLFRALALDGRMERRARRGSGPYVISLTGGGGKTSLIRRLAWEGMEQGLKVFVTTTTHMAVPLRLGVFSGSGQDVKEMLDREHAVVAGQTNGAGKISYMGDGAYGSLCPLADLVLVEADGAKRLPLKVPRGNEPIIPDNTDLILCVSGLSAAGSLVAEKCFRLDAAQRIMEAHGRKDYNGGEGGPWRITLEDMGCLMRYGYLEPLRAQYPRTEVLPVWNQADTRELGLAAAGLLDEMKEDGGIVAGRLLGEESAGLF